MTKRTTTAEAREVAVRLPNRNVTTRDVEVTATRTYFGHVQIVATLSDSSSVSITLDSYAWGSIVRGTGL